MVDKYFVYLETLLTLTNDLLKLNNKINLFLISLNIILHFSLP